MPHRDLGGEKIRFGSEMCDMAHNLAEKLAKHSRKLDECAHEARAKVRSSDEGVPLTHGRGVCSSGNRSHSHPARVPARCGRTSAPSRHRATSAPAYHSSYLRNFHSFNNRSYPHPLSAGSSKGGMQEERQVAGPAGRTRQSLALARLLVPARGTGNCKQSSCCCAVVR